MGSNDWISSPFMVHLQGRSQRRDLEGCGYWRKEWHEVDWPVFCSCVMYKFIIWNLIYMSWGFGDLKIFHQISWTSWKTRAKLIIVLKEPHWIKWLLKYPLTKSSHSLLAVMRESVSRVYELQNEMHIFLIKEQYRLAIFFSKMMFVNKIGILHWYFQYF